MTDCLQGLVGVSDADCEDCHPRPEGWEASSSGLYLGGLLPLNMMEASKKCGEDDLWEAGAKALEEAATGLQVNLQQCWQKNNIAVPRFADRLAQHSGSSQITPGTSFAGIVITPNHKRRKGRLVIEKIHALFEGTGSFTLLVYDQMELLSSVSVSTTAGALTTTTISGGITVPLSRTGVDGQRIYLIYAVNGSNLPYNNLLRNQCGCGGNFKERLKPWAWVDGTKGDTLADRCKWSVAKNCYGLIPEVRFECDLDQVICEGGMTPGVDPNAGIVAEYLYYMGAAKLAERILRSDKINVWTMIDGEQLANSREVFVAEAMARINELCGSDLPCKSGCFDRKQFGKRTSVG